MDNTRRSLPTLDINPLIVMQSKKKAKPEIIIDRNTRNKKKCVTTVFGLDSFGIKLSEAAKLFAKKYAGGAAVQKTPTEKEQIDVQVGHTQMHALGY